MRFLLLLLTVLFIAACDSPEPADVALNEVPAAGDAVVKTGAQVLSEASFAALSGKRVGLIANHTARVDTVHLIDLMHGAEGVTLGALFGPEHGIRGDADAGEKIGDGVDDRTGAPIYSLYGDTRKPTPEMLEGLDALIFDIQDVGTRFYTYISTMGLAMQAAADAGIPFYVLDRPNPLGGERVAGWLMDPAHKSFVGQYRIPIVHGLTVGELATMIKEEALFEGLEGLTLEVIPVEGWSREMAWPDTGLPWIAPSPNIPDYETALVYPGAGFFEAVAASEGRGTRQPFLQVGAPWADGQALADTLNARGLAGVRFEPVTFTPESIEGMSSNPKLKGEALQGVRYVITDDDAFQPVEAGVHLLHAFYSQAPAGEKDGFISRSAWLAKLSGAERFHQMLTAGAAPAAIIADWQSDVAAFKAQRAPYLKY